MRNFSTRCEKALAKCDHVLFCMPKPYREIPMKRWTLLTAAAGLLAAAVWQLPANAQRAPTPTTDELISFEQYRDFRIRDLQQRQTRLARQLAAPGLSAAEKTSIERRKDYYDQLATM